MEVVAAPSAIRVGGRVRFFVRASDDQPWTPLQTVENTATNYALASLAQWWTGVSNTPGNPNAVLPPTYVALGTGTQTPSPSDQFMFAEGYGTRVRLVYTLLTTSTTGLIAASYQTTQALGTWSEVGLWDGATLSATVGAGGVSSGTTTLPLGSNAPAVTGGSTPGQYTTLYINDGASSEYCSIATSANAGASSWTLQANLQYNHAAATPIVVFGGNLWAHAAVSPAVTKTSGSPSQLLVQWSAPFTATGS